MIAEILAKLRPLERETSPFATVPKMPKVRKGDVVWVEPELVCEVEFLEWTHDGHLRAPSFQGLREDKPARSVRREDPAEMDDDGLKLSNLDKLFWPEDDPNGPITKGDLIDYYSAVAPVLVPHLKARPFTMRGTPTAPTARRSSRRTRRSTCPSGSRASPSRSRPASARRGAA